MLFRSPFTSEVLQTGVLGAAPGAVTYMQTRTFAAAAPVESVAVAVMRKAIGFLLRMIVPGFKMIEILPTDALVEISTLFEVWFPAPSVAVTVSTFVPSRSAISIENAPLVVDRPLSIVPVVSLRTWTSMSLSVFPVTAT